MRAATCAGPIRAPAATACSVVAPAASRMRGRCAAIAPVTLQAAAKANASRTMVRSIGMCGFVDAATAALAPFTDGSMKKLSGRPIRICASGPGEAGVAPADAFEPERRQRPSDGRGKAREQRDAGDRAARGIAIDAPQRGEGGVVQAEAHADAEQQPGDDQHRNRSRWRRAAPVRRPASDWRSTAPACRRRGRSAGRRAGRAVPRSPATPRTPQRSSSRRRRGRARSDRPGSRADNSSKPTPAFAWCRAPG